MIFIFNHRIFYVCRCLLCIAYDGSGTHSEASGNEVVQDLTIPVSYTLNQNPINKKQLNEFNCHYAITPFPLNYIKS